MDEQTLEPCPFCGNDAELVLAPCSEPIAYVSCECGANGADFAETDEGGEYVVKAIAAWNHRAAHSIIAGKVAELTEALIEARSAIATWSETPCEHDYKKHDALCYIDAALAPYPERRSE